MLKALNYWMVALLVCAGSAAASELASAPKDFTLKTYDGKNTFQLSKNQSDYVALHFLLKTECPICLRYTQEYQKNAKKHPNVAHVFIKPDEANEIGAWAAKFDMPKESAPKIYQDHQAALAKQFKIPHGYKFHGETVHYPALIILDKTGKEVFRHIGEKTQDRFYYPKFEEKMKSMK